jgi:PKHD-type hydroxylase
MISKYLSYHHNFDDIVKNDPSKMAVSDYWYLKSHNPSNWCWNSDMFSSQELERIIVLGKRLIPSRAETGTGQERLDIRRSYISWININSETSWIFGRITEYAIENNKKYWNYDLDKIERIQFTHYLSEENGAYLPHVDPLHWSNPHNRKLSFVLQLSDPSEYEGGELRLNDSPPNLTTVRKQKGLAAFFPSHILHEVTPVTKGERYSLVAWIHGPNLR